MVFVHVTGVWLEWLECD